MAQTRADEVIAQVKAAKMAGRKLSLASGPERRSMLLAMADMLDRPDRRESILAANSRDLSDAERARQRGELSAALVDRLRLSPAKLDGLCDGLRQLASMNDLVGQTLVERPLDEGLLLRKVTCPLGVVGVVFEARPDAVPQIAGLCMRTANAVVLKGGHEARRSNAALVDALRQALADQSFDPRAIVLLEAREDVTTLLGLHRDVDLVVARGSSRFVEYIQEHSEIPVLGHAEGLCHLYLHHSASPAMAARIAVDAKCSYPAACNAIETLLWEPGSEQALDAVVSSLREQGVRLRGCEHTVARHSDMEAADEEDWSTEYSDKKLSIRRVDDIFAALEHIERYGSRHTETIVAADDEAASLFVATVDAACVFENASSRFADGYRMGLGAELGISTGKLHARGPVGAEGLVTHRWLLRGNGHISTEYGPGKKSLRFG